MQQIDFYQKIEGKKQAAFIAFFALDGKPWHNYPTDETKLHQLVIPTCLMMNRADGTVGFIGGKVDGEETLEEAAIREVKEEIGHAVNLELEPIVAHDIGPITTHLFAAEIPYLQLRQIQDDAIHADHFGSEVTGVFLPHLIDYTKTTKKKGGLIHLLQYSMPPSVREELVHFLLKKEIIDKQELDKLCNEAGYSLKELLK